MRRITKRCLSLVLVMVMLATVFFANTGVTATAETLTANPSSVEAVNPKAINDSVNTILDSFKAIGADESCVYSLKGIFTKASNISKLSSGIVGIMQALGIIKDPTAEGIKTIITILEQQNIKLNEISTQITDLSKQIKMLSIDQEYIARAQRAQDQSGYWLKYQTDYFDKLKESQGTFKSWLYDELMFYSEGKMDGGFPYERYELYAFYTKEGTTKSQVYCSLSRSSMTQTKSDSDEVIDTNSTICLPQSYIDAALKRYSWDASKFRAQVTERLSEAVKKAADDGKLECSIDFKTKWLSATDPEKTTIATNIANDLFNTLSYNSSFEAINKSSDRREEVNKLIVKMSNALDMALRVNTGIAAQIESIKSTYSFEGEAKDKLNAAYNGSKAILAYYSLFTLSLAKQCKNVDVDTQTALRDKWVITTNNIKKNHDDCIMGADNYCYLTGTCLTFKSYKVYTRCYIETKTRTSGATRILDWKDEIAELRDSSDKTVIGGLNIAGDKAVGVMYKIWGKLYGSGSGTFSKYLNKYGTNVPATYTGDIVTGALSIAETFSLNDMIQMKCIDVASTFKACSSKFTKGNIYSIMEVANRANTVLHQKNSAVTVDLTNGNIKIGNMLSGRALYCEKHNVAKYDHPISFATKSIDTIDEWLKKDRWTYNDTRFTYNSTTPFYVLEQTAAPKKNDVVYGEYEYDPNASTEANISENIIGASRTVNEDATKLTLENWKSMDISNVISEESDELFIENIREYVDSYIDEYNEDGKTVALSDDEKDELVSKIFAEVRGLESELKSNANIKTSSNLDPLGIYGDNDKMLELAKKVLPSYEITDDGKTVEPIENMISSLDYEVFVSFKYNENEQKLVPEVVVNATPKLLVYFEDKEEVASYFITDDILEELGLKATVRLSASSAGDNNVANIVRYSCPEDTEVIETITSTIKGEGNDRYAEAVVDATSAFAISFSYDANATSTGGRTGDTSNIALYIILASILVTASVTVVFFGKRKKSLK